MRRVFTRWRGSSRESCRGVSRLRAAQTQDFSSVILSPYLILFFFSKPSEEWSIDRRGKWGGWGGGRGGGGRGGGGKGGGRGEGRLRREQSAGLGCCGSPGAVLGSAFTPPLQQCEAAARAACCSHRLPQNKDTESPSAGFRILQLCSLTHSCSHQHAHSCSILSRFVCFFKYICISLYLSLFILSSGLRSTHTSISVLFNSQFSASLHQFMHLIKLRGGLGDKISGWGKPQLTSCFPAMTSLLRWIGR